VAVAVAFILVLADKVELRHLVVIYQLLVEVVQIKIISIAVAMEDLDLEVM